jgi:hypothetical protein
LVDATSSAESSSTESSSEVLADVPVYPTTSFPAPMLPPVASEPLPQVQTSEPAIAQLKGVVVETASR